MGRTLIRGAAAAVMVWASTAAAAAADAPGSRRTREFVQEATQSDTFEMMEGYSALAQSTDPQVRAFAQRMIAEHRQTSAALQDAAARSGLTAPPMSLSSDQSQLLASLQSLRGREFDQAYARHQALAHRSALTVEQGYAQNGDTPALKATAAAATPIIAAHLQMAEQLHAQLSGP